MSEIGDEVYKTKYWIVREDRGYNIKDLNFNRCLVVTPVTPVERWMDLSLKERNNLVKVLGRFEDLNVIKECGEFRLILTSNIEDYLNGKKNTVLS